MSARPPIRVLIVDDVAESRDNVEKLLRFESDVQVVGKASRGQEGIDLAERLHPDIVLMDVNMPDMDGITATMEINSRIPTVSVIMMSVQDEPDILRRAMLAGAREFLSKPFSLEDLVTAIRHVSKLAQQTQRLALTSTLPGSTQALPIASSGANVFGVFSSKGGVGRTVVASNLAVAIRQLTNKKVVLVDASLSFGDVGVMMNVAEARTIADVVVQAQSLDQDLLEDVLVQHTSGVRLLLAPMSPQEAETITADHMRTIITVLSKMADYVVIDTRPGFDEAMLSVMDVCDRLLLVLTMEMTSIKDTRQFLEIAELLGYPDDKIRLVLNRFNSYSGIPATDIAENLKRELESKIPDDSQAVLRSINEGAPLIGSQPDHKVSVEILKLASSLVVSDLPESIPQGQSGVRSPRIVSRLRTALGHA